VAAGNGRAAGVVQRPLGGPGVLVERDRLVRAAGALPEVAGNDLRAHRDRRAARVEDATVDHDDGLRHVLRLGLRRRGLAERARRDRPRHQTALGDPDGDQPHLVDVAFAVAGVPDRHLCAAGQVHPLDRVGPQDVRRGLAATGLDRLRRCEGDSGGGKRGEEHGCQRAADLHTALSAGDFRP
jgi:hypothetical protein